MKQKTLKKSARFISILLNIGCIIFGILSVLLLLGIIGIVFTQLFSPEMFREAWATAVQAGQSLSLIHIFPRSTIREQMLTAETSTADCV